MEKIWIWDQGSRMEKIWIQNPGSGMEKIRILDPGSGINIPDQQNWKSRRQICWDLTLSLAAGAGKKLNIT